MVLVYLGEIDCQRRESNEYVEIKTRIECDGRILKRFSLKKVFYLNLLIQIQILLPEMVHAMSCNGNFNHFRWI